MMGMGPMMMGMGWFGLVALFALVAGLTALLAYLFLRQNAREPAAEELLKQRLARGEISREQFEQMRGLLR